MVVPHIPSVFLAAEMAVLAVFYSVLIWKTRRMFWVAASFAYLLFVSEIFLAGAYGLAAGLESMK